MIKQNCNTSHRFHHQWPLDVTAQHVTLHQRFLVEVLIIHPSLTNLISENFSELFYQLNHYYSVKWMRNKGNKDFQQQMQNQT